MPIRNVQKSLDWLRGRPAAELVERVRPHYRRTAAKIRQLSRRIDDEGDEIERAAGA